VESASNLWRAVRIVAIADIVMSLDNVIAIAASAEVAAARVDMAHAAGIKATLIILRLKLDEILAGVALVLWIIVDRISEGMLGANADALKIWGIRGVLLLVMAGAYVIARKQWHIEEQKV
jgi:predicted tellurium resistance membrane protein TerC